MKYIFGNWKMYLDATESAALAQALSSVAIPDQLQAAVFPNTLAFTSVQTALQATAWSLGSQNVAWTPQGAYTGAISALMFKEAGANYALVGHSERRHIFHETDLDTHKKMLACFDVGLIPILCIGETKEDKDAGKRQYRLKKQLMGALTDLPKNYQKFMVAYEPVWAISHSGLGEPCVPADADDVQGWIKLELKQYTDQAVPVVYGGSVDADNVSAYLACDTVDGVLVGKASSTLDSFRAVLEQAGKHTI